MSKAIVVGASSGIGRELVKIFAGRGYEVGAMARRLPLLEELRSELGGKLHLKEGDVMQTAGAMAALAALLEEMGGADLIVLCSGIGDINGTLKWPLEEDTIRTNALGFAALANVAVHHFEARGGGQLVGISSVAALRGGRVAPAYNASKAFISNYMEGLRQKYARAKLPITITDIRPGFIQTAMAKGPGVFWSAPVEKAARQIYAAIERKKRVAYITRRWRLVALMLRFLPAFLQERL